MTTPRHPLGEISGNILQKKELTPFQRGKVVSATQFGHTPAEIAKVLKVPDATIRTTIRHDLLCDDGKSRPHSGRPKSYTDREERKILRHVRKNLKDTYAQVRQACGVNISNTMIKNIIHKHGISN